MAKVGIEERIPEPLHQRNKLSRLGVRQRFALSGPESPASDRLAQLRQSVGPPLIRMAYDRPKRSHAPQSRGHALVGVLVVKSGDRDDLLDPCPALRIAIGRDRDQTQQLAVR